MNSHRSDEILRRERKLLAQLSQTRQARQEALNGLPRHRRWKDPEGWIDDWLAVGLSPAEGNKWALRYWDAGAAALYLAAGWTLSQAQEWTERHMSHDESRAWVLCALSFEVTTLALHAGLSPAEAQAATCSGSLDVSALRLLAGLRQPGRNWT